MFHFHSASSNGGALCVFCAQYVIYDPFHDPLHDPCDRTKQCGLSQFKWRSHHIVPLAISTSDLNIVCLKVYFIDNIFGVQSDLMFEFWSVTLQQKRQVASCGRRRAIQNEPMIANWDLNMKNDIPCDFYNTKFSIALIPHQQQSTFELQILVSGMHSFTGQATNTQNTNEPYTESSPFRLWGSDNRSYRRKL